MGCGAVDGAAPPLTRGRGFDPRFCYEDDCTKEDPLSQESFRKLATPVPYSKQHHSKLVCYITKELMNSENPPLMLPHGYVYSTKSLKEMAKRNMMAELNVLGQAIPATNNVESSFKSMVTFVYGFNTAIERKSLWSNLKPLANQNTNPWIILGDFNAVLTQNDRINGDPVTPQETLDFQNCIDEIEVGQVLSRGKTMKWCNKRSGDSRIYSYRLGLW
ncbi:hypothetical protein FXO38_02651 [Capsicum annuum]|nr:hypothetical protein FXO38_02651 [Capsicum annuum]